ncbi:OmpA family protein [Flavobacterium sp. I3-2]|uniref:OmpA family protein n=1 Tax=Flavobacterium sp. I3-2 TaxID=2748319 RepID=UPI0015AA2F3F|nr:OmpA family protein [Flavobacterium sp. I3-2]
MKKGLTLLTLVSALFLGNTTVKAQAGLQTANTAYERLEYNTAKDYYEKIVSQGYANAEVLKNTGNSYYFNGNYPVAYLWYSKLFNDFDEKEIESEYDYRFAQTLMNVGDDLNAEKFFKKFAEKNTNSTRSKLINNERDKKLEIQKNSGRFSIENLTINSPYSDYGTSIYDNKLLFTSSRDTGNFTKRVFTWTGDAFTKIYSTDLAEDGSLSKPKKYSSKVDTKYNESTPIITKDGQTMYFTRNNYNKGKRGIDSELTTLLKIYRAELVNGKWTNITELPFNSNQYSSAHPVLNANENMMYFVSDRPGGFGESDIWRVSITSNGFGIPENLGSDINTDGRETFPFVTSDNELYFSSDAREGLGGLDVYATKIKSNGKFSRVQNIGAPVNSNADDFAYIIDKNSKKGYFSSNREGGVGLDDIYGFHELRPLDLECIQELRVVVLDSKIRNTISDASLSLFDKDNGAKATSTSMSKGFYEFKTDFECGETYRIKVEKNGYLSKEEVVIVADETGVTEVIVVLESIKQEPEIKVGDNLYDTLKLNPIHFGYDKANIRPDAALELQKIVDVMKKQPSLKIDVQSYTDSRGNDAYNMKLSERRAKSTAEWIISQGISASRVTYKGYGETDILNKCKNGVECTDAEHEVNRRSVFKVIQL